MAIDQSILIPAGALYLMTSRSGSVADVPSLLTIRGPPRSLFSMVVFVSRCGITVAQKSRKCEYENESPNRKQNRLRGYCGWDNDQNCWARSGMGGARNVELGIVQGLGHCLFPFLHHILDWTVGTE